MFIVNVELSPARSEETSTELLWTVINLLSLSYTQQTLVQRECLV
jgi:hypothetical protein